MFFYSQEQTKSLTNFNGTHWREIHKFSKHIYALYLSRKQIPIRVSFQIEEKDASMLNLILPGCDFCHAYEPAVT